jgi:hypothetical protein
VHGTIALESPTGGGTRLRTRAARVT